MENPDGASTCRKGCDCGFEVDLVVEVDRRCSSVQISLDISKVRRDLDPQPAAPTFSATLEHSVERDAMQPRRECTLPPIRTKSFPHPHKDVLHQFLGQDPVRTQPKTKRKYPPDMGVVEGRERRLVAALCRQYRGLDQVLAGSGPGLEWDRHV